MALQTDKIQCPNCSHLFDVEEALSGRLEQHFREEFEKKVAEQANRYKAKEDSLQEQIVAFENKKQKENEIFKQKLAEKLVHEKELIKKQTHEDFELKLKSLEEENNKRKEENRELRSKEISLLKRENELKEKQEEMELALQKKLLESQKGIEEQARLKEREANAMKLKEYEKQMDDQQKLIEEMKRKSEQGSMQLQGEVQELALEELLKSAFPFDSIEEVPKGINGADVIQTVVNSNQRPCGKIVYESKRTKNFEPKWIEKLKQDTLRVKGDISVLVTAVLPKGMNRFDNKDGVWICSFTEVSSLSKVLRESLLKLESVKVVQDNKGDKMEMMYNYLTGNDFVQKIRRIIENYDSMVLQLNSEKRAMHKIWAQREKQMMVVQENISALFGDIKGIAGNSLDDSNVLELSEPDFDE